MDVLEELDKTTGAFNKCSLNLSASTVDSVVKQFDSNQDILGSNLTIAKLVQFI